MIVKIEEVEKNKLKLEITVNETVLEAGLDRAYKKSAKRFSVPGFRKGRAPRSLVERYYGVEVLYEGAVDEICPELYDQAVKDNNLEPVDAPELDLVKLERGEPFVFTATVTVKPEVTLGQYKGVEVAYKREPITEDEVDEELKRVADRNARLIPVEDRAAENGDTLLIDYEGSIDGVPFEGGKDEGHNLVLGEKRFIEGFEEQLIGKNADEETEVRVRFPDEYHAEHLKGKDAVFQVKIHSIKKKELPEIDDDFARDVSEFDTLEEYRADVRKHLTEHQEEDAKKEFENALITKIVGDAQIDVPDAMIRRQSERDAREFEMSLAYQGLDLDGYFRYTGTTRDELDKSMRERAETEVRTQLVFEKIAKAESIEASDDDLEKELRGRAETYKKEYEEYRATVSEDMLEYIRAKLTTDKLVEFLSEHAVKA